MNDRLVNERLSELMSLVNKPMFIEYHKNWYYLYIYMNGKCKDIASGIKQDLVFDLEQFLVIAKLTRRIL